MKRIVSSNTYSYDNEFWTLHEEGGYDEGVKLEHIISDLGWNDDFFPEDGSAPTATDEQYDEVLRIYREHGGHTTAYNDEKLLYEVMNAVYQYIDGARVQSFEDAGMLTNNKGFVIEVNGKEYQFELLGSF